MSEGDVSPPKFDTIETAPRGRVDVMDVKPILDHLPNTNREAAFEEEVVGRFVMASA
jgi:hypothetical protein